MFGVPCARWQFLLVVGLLLFSIPAMAQTTPPETPPASTPEMPTTTEPTTVTLSTPAVLRVGSYDAPNSDQPPLVGRADVLIPLGTSRMQLGFTPAELRFYTKQDCDDTFDYFDPSNQLKLTWMPISVYVIPVVATKSFKKTGALLKNTTQGTETVEDPKAETHYTYQSFLMYGIITANAHHLFDWSGTPLQTDHARLGIGFLWAHQHDITDGVAYDKQHCSSDLQVQSHGFEISRSITGGEPTWYFSYVTTFQESGKHK